MHILQLLSPFVLRDDDVILPGEYVVDDIAGAQLMGYAGDGTMDQFKQTRPFNENKDWNGKNILVLRAGGLGDLTLLTPILREIVRRWPLVKLTVCCMKEYAQALLNLPYVHELVPTPMPLEKMVKDYDCWIMLENVIEKNPDARKLHSVDVVAKFIGLSGDFNKVQDYRVTDNERIWASEAYPRISSQRRLVIQLTASAACRTWSREKTGQVVAAFMNKGWEVFLMGNPNDKFKIEERPGLKLVIHGFSFRQRCAVVETADCVLAPDSSLTHIAGALGIPCVALYGPFPWQVRTKYNPKTTALTGAGACAPCFHHATHRANQFPPNCPSAHLGFCAVLEDISVERVVAKIEAVANKFMLEVVE